MTTNIHDHTSGDPRDHTLGLTGPDIAERKAADERAARLLREAARRAGRDAAEQAHYAQQERKNAELRAAAAEQERREQEAATRAALAAGERVPHGEIAAALAVLFAPVFGDDGSAREYADECRAAHGAQLCEYAVSPRCALSALDGRRLTAGDPVTLADVGRAALDYLTGQGVLLRVDQDVCAVRHRPADATHRVVGRGSVRSLRRGIVPPGGFVSARDFATEAVAAVDEVAPVLAPDGSVRVSGVAAQPARAATDGREALAYLMERGCLEPLPTTPARGARRA